MRKILTIVFLVFLVAAPSAFAQTWPNEQAGSTLITDFGFDTLNGSGWGTVGGGASIISDATAPLSPNSVLQAFYGIGFAAGVSPMITYYSTPNNREMYFGLYWKASNPWQQETGSDMSKILFMMSNDGSFDMFCGMKGNSTHRIACQLEFQGISNSHLPNSNGDAVGSRNVDGQTTVDVPLGSWHRLEFYFKYSTSTTSQDGTLQWWVNGIQVANYTTVNFPSSGFAEFQISPTWGGTNNTKTENDYFWFDHVHLSRPAAGGGDTTAPSSVSITSPTNGQTITTATFSMTGACTDNTACTSNTYKFGTGTPNTTACVASSSVGNTWPCTWTLPQNGTYNVNVTGCDAANNCTTSSSVSITVNKPLGIAFVQSRSLEQASVTSISRAFLSDNTAGNFIVVCFRAGSPSGRTVTVSDSAGNTYFLARREVQTTDDHETFIYYAMNIASGPNTVTASISGSAVTLRLIPAEFFYIATSGALDQFTGQPQTNTTNLTSGNITTTQADELLVACGTSSSGTPAWSAGTNYILQETVNKLAFEYRIVSSTLTTAGTFTISPTDNTTALIVSFKGQVSGGGSNSGPIGRSKSTRFRR